MGVTTNSLGAFHVLPTCSVLYFTSFFLSDPHSLLRVRYHSYPRFTAEETGSLQVSQLLSVGIRIGSRRQTMHLHGTPVRPNSSGTIFIEGQPESVSHGILSGVC